MRSYCTLRQHTMRLSST